MMDDEEILQRQILFARDVLDMFWQLDIHDELFWRVDVGMPSFYAKCSDVFFWGGADLELLTPKNLPELQIAYKDILAAVNSVAAQTYCTSLFAARQRGMRPQHAVYTIFPPLWDLYDACGPEREAGFGNPHKHPRNR